MKRILRFVILLLVLVACAVGGWLWYTRPKPSPDAHYDIAAARVSSLRSMSSLCTLTLREELMMRDSVRGQWIVARVKVEGRILFDLDSMKYDRQGDTLTIRLPFETMEIRENAGPDAYEVLDSWDAESMLMPRTLTTAEENVIKQRWARQVRGRLYKRGLHERARRNAVETVERLVSTWPEVADGTLKVRVKGRWEAE
ncbi:MAG: hypothetical protein K2J24_04105 [Muribaculaceae bacterium]|nr:hypothetical protein [Muribaculaceae bacterium]MDE7189177.1 hypothetical protein [Muribaculaceae bacterium]